MPVILALSPHLDDAVFSVGASILAAVEAGHRVVVCTVLAGDPPDSRSPAGRAFHRHCGLTDDDAVATRRAEDRAATALLRAEHRHLPLVDCLYRRVGDRWPYDRPGAASIPGWPAEPDLCAAIERHLGDLLDTLAPTEVWTCAAVGGHVDHRLVRAAAQRVCGPSLTLWEDIPYAYGTAPPAAEVTDAVRTTDRHLRSKLAAVAHYGSQVRGLWPDDPHWGDSMLAHAAGRRTLLGTAEPMWPAAALAAEPVPSSRGTERG
ncbi:PIG-L family deacetylase [Dactylosporangium sp. NPDC051485]|uniref:PIG-L deacetylase family protein n=1 Tax=Dactylosporangium sp. NPDC051485 TaxID=3154846 RepID=UPI00343808DD